AVACSTCRRSGARSPRRRRVPMPRSTAYVGPAASIAAISGSARLRGSVVREHARPRRSVPRLRVEVHQHRRRPHLCAHRRRGAAAPVAARLSANQHDEADRVAGRKITCPLLAIWGGAGGIPAETEGPLATWREWATDVRGFAINCGHYLAEEAP